MSGCHTKPFIGSGISIPLAADAPAATSSGTMQVAPAETCDYCGSTALEWRKCKLICSDCRQINKSCADL